MVSTHVICGQRLLLPNVYHHSDYEREDSLVKASSLTGMDRLAFAPLSGSTGSHLQEHILYNILVKPSLVLSLSLSLQS